MSDKQRFWAVVELMGHQKMAGLVEETEIAGSGFLRIDVPKPDGDILITRFVSPSAIYAISPVSEEIARAAADRMQETPVSSYDVPLLANKIREEVRRGFQQNPAYDRVPDDDAEF